jgi:hypothetical protein
VDPIVDLCITQLLKEGGTTWPRVHPHGSRPLMERLKPMAEKGPQKVHAHQLSVGLGDRAVTHEHRERHVSIIPEKEPYLLPPVHRFRQGELEVGTDSVPRLHKDVHAT